MSDLTIEPPRGSAALGSGTPLPPQELSRLTKNSLLIWLVLHVTNDPSTTELGDWLGISSDRTITAALDLLESLGFAAIDRTIGLRNRYELLRHVSDLVSPLQREDVVPLPEPVAPTRRRWQSADKHKCRSLMELLVDDRLHHLCIPHWRDVPYSRLVPEHDGQHTLDFFVPGGPMIEVAPTKTESYQATLDFKRSLLRARGLRLVVIERPNDIYRIINPAMRDRMIEKLRSYQREHGSLDNYKTLLGRDPTVINRQQLDSYATRFQREQDGLAALARRRAPKRHPDRPRHQVTPNASLTAERKRLRDNIVEVRAHLRSLLADAGHLLNRVTYDGGKPMKALEAREVQGEAAKLLRRCRHADLEHTVRLGDQADRGAFARARRSWFKLREREIDEREEAVGKAIEIAHRICGEARGALLDAETQEVISPRRATTFSEALDTIEARLNGEDDD